MDNLWMQFDRNKLKAVILHTCHSCPPDRLGAVKLHKVLYFLDMIAYAQTGLPVTGATYRKRPFGSTCVALLPMLRDMAVEGKLQIRETEYYGLRKKEYVALVPEPPGVLNDNEIALLDEVIDFVCERNTARTISDYSHQAPWERAEFGDVIPYSSAYLLYPSQVSPEGFEAAERGLQEIAGTRSDREAVVFTDIEVFRRRLRPASA